MQMSQSLMQQASAMLVSTNHLLQGLRQQHYTGVQLDSLESCSMQPSNGFINPSNEPSTVQIVDVTDDVDDHNQSNASAEDALLFPAVTLPF